MSTKIFSFQGVNFNAEFWKEKSEAEFIKHEKHTGLTEAQLKEAYSIMNGSKPTKKKVI